jgi:hypothetical protein
MPDAQTVATLKCAALQRSRALGCTCDPSVEIVTTAIPGILQANIGHQLRCPLIMARTRHLN